MDLELGKMMEYLLSCLIGTDVIVLLRFYVFK